MSEHSFQRAGVRVEGGVTPQVCGLDKGQGPPSHQEQHSPSGCCLPPWSEVGCGLSCQDLFSRLSSRPLCPLVGLPGSDGVAAVAASVSVPLPEGVMAVMTSAEAG